MRLTNFRYAGKASPKTAALVNLMLLTGATRLTRASTPEVWCRIAAFQAVNGPLAEGDEGATEETLEDVTAHEGLEVAGRSLASSEFWKSLRRSVGAQAPARCGQSQARPEPSARVHHQLVYQVQPDGSVVFAPRARALWVGSIWAAMSDAQTWAELAGLLACDEFERLLQISFDELGEPRPNTTDAFSPDSLAGFSEGDYPPWLAAEIGSCLPTDFCEAFGRRIDTMLNGSFWRFPKDRLQDMVSALTKYGCEVAEARGYVLR